MAIRMMTTREAYEAREQTGRKIERVSNYPGHVEGTISHSPGCPHFARLGGKPGWSCDEMRPEGLYDDCLRSYDDPRASSSGRCYGPTDALYMETTHEGVVLELREYNGYDDSDFYAMVWNAEKGAPERVDYATTRGWTYPNGAKVDATPEVLAAYAEWEKKRWAEAQARADAERAARIEAEAKAPRKGRSVKVVRGRKVPIGFQGVVIWTGLDNWGKTRIGIKDRDGKVVFTAASNAEALQAG